MVQISKAVEKKLIEEAIKAREKSFVPVSNSKVGVAVLMDEGSIYTSAALEFARSMTVHAEQSAFAKVLLEHIGPKMKGLTEEEKHAKIKEGFKEIVAIVEVNSKGIPGCGVCRQVALELNPGMLFYGVTPDGKIAARKTVAELYPYYYRSNDKFNL